MSDPNKAGAVITPAVVPTQGPPTVEKDPASIEEKKVESAPLVQSQDTSGQNSNQITLSQQQQQYMQYMMMQQQYQQFAPVPGNVMVNSKQYIIPGQSSNMISETQNSSMLVNAGH